MTTITALIFHDEALLDEVAQAAKARGMHIIGNGKRIVVSPIVPPGWFKITVKIKTRTESRLEAIPCAA